MTDHPLTEAAVAELWDEHRTHNAVPFHEQGDLYMRGQTAMLRAAFDAGREHERATPVDARPWEPLNGPVCVGDEVRQDRPGMTITAVVGRVDKYGDPETAEGNFIGRLGCGTWYFRRPVQELPTEKGAVIVTNDGHEYITATVDGVTYRAREAVLVGEDDWYAAWRSDARVMPSITPEEITPGTWKVDNQ